MKEVKGKNVWIDMESSLRTIVLEKDGSQKDIFSIDKCFSCVQIGIKYGLPISRFTLLTI